MRMPNERLSDVFGPRLFAFGFRSQSEMQETKHTVELVQKQPPPCGDPLSRKFQAGKFYEFIFDFTRLDFL